MKMSVIAMLASAAFSQPLLAQGLETCGHKEDSLACLSLKYRNECGDQTKLGYGPKKWNCDDLQEKIRLLSPPHQCPKGSSRCP